MKYITIILILFSVVVFGQNQIKSRQFYATDSTKTDYINQTGTGSIGVSGGEITFINNSGSYANLSGLKNADYTTYLSNKITVVNTSTYTITATDYIICVNYSTTGATTITLPSASSCWNSITNKGKAFLVKDSGANSSAYNITINRAGSDTITDSATGQTSTIVSGNGDAITVQAINSTTWIIY